MLLWGKSGRPLHLHLHLHLSLRLTINDILETVLLRPILEHLRATLHLIAIEILRKDLGVIHGQFLGLQVKEICIEEGLPLYWTI
jgi:hypothetical protein